MCKCIVTDFSLLKRMLFPSAVLKEDWLSCLRKTKIRDADVIDTVSTFPSTSSVIEVAQALIYHYAYWLLNQMKR